MELIERTIPAFSMWKTFNEMILTLTNVESSENSVKRTKRLVSVIKSEEFYKILIYNHNPNLTMEQIEEINQKYKSYTVWVLGRFFYLLGNQWSQNTHDLIIDVHIKILDYIAYRLPNIYNELTEEYIMVFQQLTLFNSRKNCDKFVLRAFVPNMSQDIADLIDLSPIFVEISNPEEFKLVVAHTLKFMEFILIRNLQLYRLNSVVHDGLVLMLSLLKNSYLDVKLIIFDVYANILKTMELVESNLTLSVLKVIDEFPNHLEALTYDIYEHRITLNEEQNLIFNNLLLKFLLHHKNIPHKSDVIIHVASFLINLDDNVHDQEAVLKLIETSIHILSSICVGFNYVEKLREINIQFVRKYPNALKLFKTQIGNEIRVFLAQKNIRNVDTLHIRQISPTFCVVQQIIDDLMVDNLCQNTCQFTKLLTILRHLVELIVQLKVEIQLLKFEVLEILEEECLSIFFKEDQFILKYLKAVNHHLSTCKNKMKIEDFLLTTVYLSLILNNQHMDVLFYMTVYPFFRRIHCDSQIITSLSSSSNTIFIETKQNLQKLSKHLLFSEHIAIQYACLIIKLQDTNLMPLNTVRGDSVKENFLKFANYCLEENNAGGRMVILEHLPNIISYCKCLDQRTIRNLQKALMSNDHSEFEVPTLLSSKFHAIFCVLTSTYVTTIQSNNLVKDDKQNVDWTVKLQCTVCLFDLTDVNAKQVYKMFQNGKYKNYEFFGVKKQKKQDNLINFFYRTYMHYLQTFSHVKEVQLNCIKCLESVSNHFPNFCAQNCECWLNFVGHGDVVVRNSVNQVVYFIFKNLLKNTTITNEKREEILQNSFAYLLRQVKISLQNSDEELQHTLIDTIRNISTVKIENVQLPVMKLLLFYIMFPNSYFHWIAVNIFVSHAELYDMSTLSMYQKYKRELCKEIVELCAINQALINSNLKQSLDKVSMLVEHGDCQNFVKQNCNYMLAYLIPIIVKMPKVSLLVEEIAALLNLNLPELLANNYGSIFLQVFLHEDKFVFQKSMQYLESVTTLEGPALRQRNFKTILNELLLNFHEKRERVLLALELLAQEEPNATNISEENIPDYLQPKFLGVLQYFDSKLISREVNKAKVLRSLSSIFRYMGAKRITPLRFKIIAMLRTALNFNTGDFPRLNCEVWNCFVRTCDIDALGPQLATIFISLLPLEKTHSKEIHAIFRYLIIENERYLKDYVLDLFFVLEHDLDNQLLMIIRKCMEQFEKCSFRERVKKFIKYLTHETIDVKICGFRYMKKLLEKNRDELDQMILGCNGMDMTMVELVDILTLGCREKDPALKLACGECFGELGAIEPSHLPRRQNQEAQTFPFFINEDAFILNSLNEFIRALQAEKNTQNMDRLALAIQETLRTYGISPDTKSIRHKVWRSFPEVHQELMVPLLSSRYTRLQNVEPVQLSPIYGSNFGSSFQLWIHNWTTSLITTLNEDKQNFLQACLVSLKQDHRLLMQFLPHILLHSLLEGGESQQERAYTELIAVVNSCNTKLKLDPHIFNLRPLRQGKEEELKSLRGSKSTYSSRLPVPENENNTQCKKVVFVILDFMDRWVREWEWQKGAIGRNDGSYKTIETFLSRFCKLQLARCNFECGEYSRALMYLEDYIEKNPADLDNNLHFLAEIYAQQGEADGVTGVAAIRQSEPTLEERILALEVSGKLADAAACYEMLKQPLKHIHLKGLVQCYLDLDNVNTALYLATKESDVQLLEIQAEPLWRLGRYDSLTDLFKKPEVQKNKSWGVQMGRALINFRNGNRDEFKTVLTELKGQQVDLFGASSLEEGAYQHGYGCIAKLHSLNELEQVEKLVHDLTIYSNDKTACEGVMKKLVAEFELRLKVVQQSIKITEPILCLRRVAIEQAKNIVKAKSPRSIPLLDALLGETWLLSAKAARISGLHQQAHSYTIKAEEHNPACLFLEKAKLHWLRLEHDEALRTLKRGLKSYGCEGHSSLSSSKVDVDVSKLTVDERKICAKAQLLIARYNDAISNVETSVNILHYKEAVDMYKECEKSLVLLGQYYDRLFQKLSDDDRDSKGSEMQIHMINYFGKSLLYGTNYVYQSMPRLLSIWFDYGTRLLDVNLTSIKEERKNNLLKMTKLVDSFLDRLPTFIFLTCFSQLVSRICHPQKEVYVELKSIIVKVMLSYPQQTMWMMMSVIKSSYAVRAKRCAEILNDSRLKTPNMSKLVTDFTHMAEKLIELCNKPINENATVVSVNGLLKSLPRLLATPNFSEIMIPIQKFRKLVLPNSNLKNKQHDPFPNHYVHIVGIADEMIILQSLQRPRKITLRGSDGKPYIQMLKPKDDLRKDFRLMEFNDIVNQLLCKESEARQRRLNIRLYSVAPLNEECGMMEWIPNLVGLRPIVMAIYKQKGIGMKARELKDSSCNIRDPLVKKKEIFLKKLLPRHPPVLGHWFKKTFPDPQAWLTARTAYIRTTAVISMVGYILGLGDRHGENILLDGTCGDTVHVDFNCLFNKGESFEWPERVPFRLTHNMVAAMGPLGVEGMYRISCACALKVLRNNIATLMSIVRPFVYDPLVSWPRIAPSAITHNAERTNDQAVEHIRNIELRLQGIVKTKGTDSSLPLSVEGQTNNLINEAMSVENLCQMYIGWGPYL